MDRRLLPVRLQLPQLDARPPVFDCGRLIVTGGFIYSIGGFFFLSGGCFISMRGFLFASDIRPAASYG